MKKLIFTLLLAFGLVFNANATAVNVKGDTIKVANDTENVTMWEGFEFGKPGVFVTYFNEWTEWVADAWTVTEVGTSTQTLADATNGALVLTSGGTENDGNTLMLGGTADSETTGESWAIVAGKDFYYESTLTLTEVTQSDIFAGLSIQDTAITASNGTDLIGFTKVDGSATLIFRSSKASAVSSQNVGTMVDATAVKVGFHCNGVTRCDAYVDGTLVASVFTAHIPTTQMKVGYEVLAGDGNPDVLTIDTTFVAMER